MGRYQISPNGQDHDPSLHHGGDNDHTINKSEIYHGSVRSAYVLAKSGPCYAAEPTGFLFPSPVLACYDASPTGSFTGLRGGSDRRSPAFSR